MVAIIFNNIVNGSNCSISHLLGHQGQFAINNSVHVWRFNYYSN